MDAGDSSRSTSKRLRRLAADVDDDVEGRFGTAVVSLERSDPSTVVTYRGDDRFGSASVIKLLVLYRLFERIDDEPSELSRSRPIADSNEVGGCGLFHLLSDPTPTLEDLATAMIVISDNAATNELIDVLEIDRINAAADRLGLRNTRLRRKMMVSPESAVEDAELAAAPGINGHRYVNTTSPEDCVTLLTDVFESGSVRRETANGMLEILRQQKDGSLVARYLPPATEIAHKTGSLPSVSIDAGILFVDERPFAYAVCCDSMPNGGRAADVVARFGKALHRELEADDRAGGTNL